MPMKMAIVQRSKQNLKYSRFIVKHHAMVFSKKNLIIGKPNTALCWILS